MTFSQGKWRCFLRFPFSKKDNLMKLLPIVWGRLCANEPLSKKNWFGVGGAAQIYFEPADVEDLALLLREMLYDNQYEITEEHLVFEEGKYYPMFRAVKCNAANVPDALELKFGLLAVLKEKDVLEEFLEREISAKKAIVNRLMQEATEKSAQRAKEIEELIEQYKEMLARVAATIL